MKRRYKYRIYSGQRWGPWRDNHGYSWMRDRMDADDGIESIVVDFDDGSKLEQRVQDGTEPWNEATQNH